MAHHVRSCSRTGCHTPAAASLSFRYATSQVWLLDLAPVTDPSLYDLCPGHADALTVPRGWDRVDQRSPASVDGAPIEDTVGDHAGRGLPEARARHHRGPAAGEGFTLHSARGTTGRPRRGPNRYAALSAELPRLAAQVAATRAPVPEGHPPELPRGERVDGDDPQDDRLPEVEGQLALGVDGQDGTDAETAVARAAEDHVEASRGAIVVPIGAGNRRRSADREDASSVSDPPIKP
jgi:hypothetical protein